MSVTLISVSHDTIVSNKHEEWTRHYYVNFQQGACGLIQTNNLPDNLNLVGIPPPLPEDVPWIEINFNINLGKFTHGLFGRALTAYGIVGVFP